MESDVRPPKRLRLTEDEVANYDVFISHRGPDTKMGFVSFLHKDLVAVGLRPFLDCKSMDIGDDSWECIEQAIKNTAIAVVVLSETFAQSEWCLRELHVMLHTPSVKVLPVFYNVRPSEVRFPESGRLKDGFEKLTRRHSKNIIEQWRADLKEASKIMGWEHSGAHKRLEGDLVKAIVGKVSELAKKPLPLDVGEYVVGVEHVAAEIIETLDDKKNVLMLGLWGMGGIGKSTLAKELYNRVRNRFAASCYIEDVTDKVSQAGGVVKVQNRILKGLLKNESGEIQDKSEGKVILEERLSKIKFLLVLDDVHDEVGDNDGMYHWISRKMLTEGSLCMVTSCNSRVFEKLNSFDIKQEVHIHDVQRLSNVDSKRMLASFASGGYWTVKQGFEELVANISEACGGVPLVLKVCGALLKHEEDVKIWNEVLEKLKCGRIMDIEKRIFDCLHISYNFLQEELQEMFLDIACALLGRCKDWAIQVWVSHGWSATLGIRSLEEKALVTVDEDGCLRMHDHLRDMGREIVTKKRIREGVIRRLWMPESLTILKENKKLPRSVQTLMINNNHMYGIESGSPIDLDVSHMEDLRILMCGNNINVTSSLPKNLRWFDWKEQSRRDGAVTIFPIVSRINKLVILDLGGPDIETICESIGNARNLVVLNLGCTWRLSWLPDSFGGLRNLQNLVLTHSRVQRLPESFGELSKLEVLNMRMCGALISLPDSFGSLRMLRDINLMASSINRLPESFGKLSKLEVLNMGWCGALISLPDSFGSLRMLRDINLKGSSIKSLPESFVELSKLEVLNMEGCKALSFLPYSFGRLRMLRDINLKGSSIKRLPESFVELSKLEVLNMEGCGALSSLPDSFGSLEMLRDINLKGSSIERLPESFVELSKLEVLNMEGCGALSFLPDSFGSLEMLRDINLKGSSIERLPESFGELSKLEVLNMGWCSALISLPDSFGSLGMLRDINLTDSSIKRLPESFGELSKLEVLNIGWCKALSSLPDSFGSLGMLRDINLGHSSIKSLPESFVELSKLEVLSLNGCKALSSLPYSFGSLRMLRDINLGWSGIKRLPESFGELSRLEVLDLEWCRGLISLPESFGSLGMLRDINLGWSGIQRLPKSFGAEQV